MPTYHSAEAQLAALIPADDGYTEADVSAAAEASLVTGVQQGLAQASEWELLDGSTVAQRSDAHGVISYDGEGYYS